MRTKILLLTAAAVAAGLASSQAQDNVYSANIVGYVNTVIKGNGAFSLIANPVDDGTNTVVSLLNALPNKSSVQVWDPNTASFIISSKALGNWSQNLSLPPGTGFFVRNAGPDLTNTFVGQVVTPVGQTNTVPLTAGVFVLRGSAIPFGGHLTDSGTNTINLGDVLPNKSSVQVWDTDSQSFVIASKALGNWSVDLPLSVGQGFFIKSAATTNWTQVLQ